MKLTIFAHYLFTFSQHPFPTPHPQKEKKKTKKQKNKRSHYIGASNCFSLLYHLTFLSVIPTLQLLEWTFTKGKIDLSHYNLRKLQYNKYQTTFEEDNSMYSYRMYWVEISVPVVLLYGRLYFLAAFIQSIGIVFIKSKLNTFVLTPWSAPLSSSFVTTSVWPLSAARWSGVQSNWRRKNNDLNILCQLLITLHLFFVTFHCPIYY